MALPRTTIPTSESHKTALDYFDEMHDDRIEKADQIPIDLSVFEEEQRRHVLNGDCSSTKACGHTKNGAPSKLQIGVDTKSTMLPPIIDLEYLHELYGATGSSEHVNYEAERHELFRLVQSRGGCCLVKFHSDSKYASGLKKMWRAMEDFYQLVDTANYGGAFQGKPSDDDNSPQDPVLMRQHLTRPEQSPNAGGYDFVQTYWDPETKRVVPTTIQDSLGPDHPCSSAIDDSFHALLEVSKMFTIVLSSGGLQRPILQMESLLNDAILDDFGCSHHRLCQYRALNNDTGSAKSLLRSHTDWSLVTCIPVSPTPGLLTFDSLYQKWLAPDTVTCSRVGGESGDDCHSQYCLMMTGKSMDMLVGVQGGMACIHQVVPAFRTQNSSTQQQQQALKNRLSAPFFLRPKESVSLQINEQCNHKPCPSQEQGIVELHQVYCKFAA